MKDMREWIAGWDRGSEEKIGIGFLTPDLAKDLLAAEVYTRGNKPSLVKRYASHIHQEEWYVTGETISLNEDGRMVEGHNRCLACIASKKPIKTAIIIGVKNEAVPYINCGMSRNISQRRGVACGRKADINRDTMITRMIQVDRITTTAGCYPEHLQANALPMKAIDKFEERYIDGINFALDHFKVRKAYLCNASTMSAVAKAYYHTRKYPGGRCRLELFCKILNNGFATSENDRAVIALRENLTDKRKNKNGTHDQGIPIYLKTVFCLDKFMCGESVSRVKKATEDLFPLPTPSNEFVPYDKELEERVVEVLKTTVIAKPVCEMVEAN